MLNNFPLHYFEKQVISNPNKNAIKFEDQILTYEQLNSKATKLANFILLHHTIQPKYIALYFKRSIDMIISLLAILKTGAAYIPLDPTYPKERTKYIIQHSQPELLITNNDSFQEHQDALGINKIINLDNAQSTILKMSTSNVNKSYNSEIAYVLYTSGTTGKPKGVLGRNSGIINRILWMNENFPFTDEDIFCLKTTLNFVDAVWDIFQPLMFGKLLVLFPQDILQNQEKFISYLNNNKITRLSIVPSHLRTLIEYFPKLSEKLPTLKLLDVTGEEFPAKLAQDTCIALPGINIINRYGTTEAPSTFFFNIKDHNHDHHGNYISIGKPISNTTVYALDDLKKIVKSSEIGEMYIGGSQLAAGYIHDMELTNNKFVVNPQNSNEILYRTGDLIKISNDGNVIYIGRKDNQVEIRGNRVELEEVEVNLGNYSKILQCAVICFKYNGDNFLSAFYTSRSGKELIEKELKEYLNNILPEYMIPLNYYYMPTLPSLPNGKLDRVYLKDLLNNKLSDFNIQEKDITEEEKKILSILSYILPMNKIKLDDNFFQHGIHSLLAIRLLTEINKKFQISLALDTIFKADTIRKLTQIVQSLTKANKSNIAGVPAIVYNDQQDNIPMSYPQKLFWRLNKKLGKSKYLYNDTWILEILGNVNIDALQYTFDNLIMNHQIFRTNYYEDNGFEGQVINPTFKFPLTFLDLSCIDSENKDHFLYQEIVKHKNNNFDLKKDYLIKASLLKISDNNYILILSTHHITEDGWSGKIINSEISKFYNNYIENISIEPQKNIIRYSDYSVWQNKCIKEKVFKSQINYWVNRLKNQNTHLEIIDKLKNNKKKDNFKGNINSFILSEDVTRKIKDIALNNKTTLFTVLLTVLFCAIRNFTKQNYLTIGTPIAHRHYANIENVIGFFPNMLMFSEYIHKGEPFKTVLEKIKLVTIEAYANQDAPFIEIIDQLHIVQDQYHPMVDITFIMPDVNPRVGETMQLHNLIIKKIDLPKELLLSKFPISFSATEKERKLQFNLLYNSYLLDETLISTINKEYEQLLYKLSIEGPTLILCKKI